MRITGLGLASPNEFVQSGKDKGKPEEIFSFQRAKTRSGLFRF